jgi:hypothetical protein
MATPHVAVDDEEDELLGLRKKSAAPSIWDHGRVD